MRILQLQKEKGTIKMTDSEKDFRFEQYLEGMRDALTATDNTDEASIVGTILLKFQDMYLKHT